MAIRPFKKQFTLQERIKESSRIISKYPDKIPLICEKAKTKNIPSMEKCKILVPWDLTVGNLIYIVRTKLKLKPEDSIFLFVGNNMMSASCVIGEIYNHQKDEDGFLYIEYSKENTFG